jgi:ATP-dependent Clp protease adapter protein ClpS
MMKAVFLLIALLLSVSNGLVSPSAASRQTSVSAASVSRDTVVMMPTMVERQTVRAGDPAILDRPDVVERIERVENPSKERSRSGGDAWEVRIYNDGMNTREHVARSLVQVTGITEMVAYQTMMRAHQNGIATVGKWCFEIAEVYNEGLRKNGIISDIVPVDEEQ